MQDDIKQLREQAVQARRLASQVSDTKTVADLKAFADECDANAEAQEAARETDNEDEVRS